jgi:hypothetical protein
MRNPLPKFTVTGRVGVGLMTFAAGKFDPQLLSPALLYGPSILGVMLVLWKAVTYAARLARHIRSKSHQGRSTFARPSQQHFGVRRDRAR